METPMKGAIDMSKNHQRKKQDELQYIMSWYAEKKANRIKVFPEALHLRALVFMIVIIEVLLLYPIIGSKFVQDSMIIEVIASCMLAIELALFPCVIGNLLFLENIKEQEKLIGIVFGTMLLLIYGALMGINTGEQVPVSTALPISFSILSMFFSASEAMEIMETKKYEKEYIVRLEDYISEQENIKDKLLDARNGNYREIDQSLYDQMNEEIRMRENSLKQKICRMFEASIGTSDAKTAAYDEGDNC